MSESEERRRFHRFPFHADCQLTPAGKDSISCELLDLSINGALLQVDDSFRDEVSPDTRLQLQFNGRVNGSRVELEMWVTAVRVKQHQIACRFTAVNADSFENLKNLVSDNLGDVRMLDRELTQLDYWPGLTISPGT